MDEVNNNFIGKCRYKWTFINLLFTCGQHPSFLEKLKVKYFILLLKRKKQYIFKNSKEFKILFDVLLGFDEEKIF